MLTPEKTCESVRAALFDAERHGGPVPSEIRTHLDACPACRTVAAELAETIRGARSWAEASSTEVQERVLARLGPTIEKASARARRPAWVAALRSPWSWAGAAVVGAAVLLVTFRPGDRPLEARVVASEGLVERSTPSAGDNEPLAADALLGPRDRIRVGPSSRVVLRLGRERAVLLERTAVAIEQLEERAIRLHLERGKIAVAVRPDPQHSSGFSVSTARAEVIVTGTLFDVHSDEEQTQVTVARGTVEVRVPDRAPARVEAGFSLTVAADRAEVRRAEPEVLAVLTALFAAKTRTSDPPRPDARGRVDEPATPNKAGAGGRRERDRDELGEVEALATRGSCRRAAEEAARLRSGSGAGPRAEAHMMVADCHHAAGQLETALELYREVATDYARTAAGQNAAYEAARLAQKLGKTEEARRAFEAFARHNRGHPLAAEALFRVCVADATTERTEAALQCLRLFRQRYPRHRRRAESFLLEATLLRTEAHDCAGAIAAYDAYLEQPGELEEQARQWRAWCVEELRRQSP